MPDSLPPWANSRIAARPPPSPRLELRTGDAVFLLLPASADTATLTRFDAMRGSDRLGRIDFAHLLDTLRHEPHAAHDSIAAIRRFYAAWRHADPNAPTPNLIRRLREDVATNRLAVFRLRQNPHHAILRTTPHTRPKAPGTQIATWSPERKVVAMLEAIPDHLAGAAIAEFRAFLTPQNLAVTAASLAGLAALQAVPGADAAIDSLIAGLAWWQFGWSGLLAARDFVEAVIKSGRATTREEIDLAAKLAAAALVSLGLTILLRDLAKRVHEAKPNAGQDAADASTPARQPTKAAASKPDRPAAVQPLKTPASPSDQARSWQGSGNYPGVDDWTDTVIPKDTIIYGGTPGQSEFYTTGEALAQSGGSGSAIFQSMQVAPHPTLGYRPEMTAYRVLQDIPAATSKAAANPQFGAGGARQFFIPDYQNALEPLHVVPLKP